MMFLLTDFHSEVNFFHASNYKESFRGGKREARLLGYGGMCGMKFLYRLGNGLYLDSSHL